jgi:hypothetical protein
MNWIQTSLVPGYFNYIKVRIRSTSSPQKPQQYTIFSSLTAGRLHIMFTEHRKAPREPLVLPVMLQSGDQGVTRNISASGVMFELDRVQQIGSVVDFEIHLDTPDGPVKLVAHGKVVRVTEQGERTGVAVQLVESRLEPGEPQPNLTQE